MNCPVLQLRAAAESEQYIVYGQYIVYKCQWGLAFHPGNEKITRENFVKVPTLLAWMLRTDTYRFHSQIKNRNNENGNKVKSKPESVSLTSVCVWLERQLESCVRACVRAGLRDYPEMLVLYSNDWCIDLQTSFRYRTSFAKWEDSLRFVSSWLGFFSFLHYFEHKNKSMEFDLCWSFHIDFVRIAWGDSLYLLLNRRSIK